MKAIEKFSFRMIYRFEFLSGSPVDGLQDPDGLLNTGNRFVKFTKNNPAASDQDPVQIIACDGKRIIGRSNLMAGRILVRGNKVLVYWGSGLFVSKDYRRQGVAEGLVRKRMKIHHTVGGCGPAQTTSNLYRKLGWIEYRMERCILVLKSNSILRRYLGRGLSDLAAPFANAVLRIHSGLITRRVRQTLSGCKLEYVEKLPETLERAMNEARMSNLVQSCRSVESINLLLRLGSSSPQRCLIVRQKERIVSFLIVRSKFHKFISNYKLHEFTLGSIKEWMIFDDALFDETTIMLIAALELKKMGADAIELTPSLSQTVLELKKLGLFTKDALKLFIKGSEDSPLSEDQDLIDPKNWSFTPSEGDNFFL